MLIFFAIALRNFIATNGYSIVLPTETKFKFCILFIRLLFAFLCINFTFLLSFDKAIYFSSQDASIARNNTIRYWSSGFYLNNNASSVIENNLVLANYGVYGSSATGSTIGYNDFYLQNSIDNPDDLPIGLGDVITINANGDSADTYLNIFSDHI